MASWPTTLTINAWTGREIASSTTSSDAKAWTLRMKPPATATYLPVPPASDPANWRDERIGWGLILVEREGFSDAELASAIDAPEPIQVLLKARNNAPVFRYRPASPFRFSHLRNYATQRDIAISAPPSGLGQDALPQYLLIYGPPTSIPWELQYSLNASRMVGRLDLEGEALENYVQALLHEWNTMSSSIEHGVIWAVDHGSGDISHLMRNAIAAPVYAKWSTDSTLSQKAVFIDGSKTQASSSAFITALSQKKPALIVTTSHGNMGPLSDLAETKEKLGLPIDQNFQPLDLDQLQAAWEPDGAIWYAHACCSAGSAASSLYRCVDQDSTLCLVKADTPIDQVLKRMADVGSQVAPLPKALLGAKKPLRAFIGHVEPTFDWTIRYPATGQFLTDALHQTLYNHIYAAKPVGLAFAGWFKSLGGLFIEHENARHAYNQGENTLNALLYCQLANRDRRSMVILGDPTVTLPLLP